MDTFVTRSSKVVDPVPPEKPDCHCRLGTPVGIEEAGSRSSVYLISRVQPTSPRPDNNRSNKFQAFFRQCLLFWFLIPVDYQ